MLLLSLNIYLESKNLIPFGSVILTYQPAKVVVFSLASSPSFSFFNIVIVGLAKYSAISKS